MGEVATLKKLTISDYLVQPDLSTVEEDFIISTAFEILSRRHSVGKSLESSIETKQYLQLLTRGEKCEVFGCLFLSNQHHLIANEHLFKGTIDGCAVYPRAVAQKCLEHNACAVIFYHNHPSGIAEPSRADIAITRRLKDALGLLDIRILDHLIVSQTEHVSMAERGLM